MAYRGHRGELRRLPAHVLTKTEQLGPGQARRQNQARSGFQTSGGGAVLSPPGPPARPGRHQQALSGTRLGDSLPPPPKRSLQIGESKRMSSGTRSDTKIAQGLSDSRPIPSLQLSGDGRWEHGENATSEQAAAPRAEPSSSAQMPTLNAIRHTGNNVGFHTAVQPPLPHSRTLHHPREEAHPISGHSNPSPAPLTTDVRLP